MYVCRYVIKYVAIRIRTCARVCIDPYTTVVDVCHCVSCVGRYFFTCVLAKSFNNLLHSTSYVSLYEHAYDIHITHHAMPTLARGDLRDNVMMRCWHTHVCMNYLCMYVRMYSRTSSSCHRACQLCVGDTGRQHRHRFGRRVDVRSLRSSLHNSILIVSFDSIKVTCLVLKGRVSHIFVLVHVTMAAASKSTATLARA